MSSNMPKYTNTKFRYVLLLICLFLLVDSSSQLSPQQNSTMKRLYELLLTQTQTKLISWDPNKDPCESSGVTCTNSSISKLSLSNLGLTNSSFLPVVCEIDTLESLDVSRNFLTSIPDDFFTRCEQIQGLKVLNFSLNRISSSFPTFNGFSSLESLDVSYNNFVGVIKNTLDGLAGLKYLNLSYNKIMGQISVNLTKFMALEELQLSTNSFQGPVPQELADCKNLKLIDLSNNKLTGNLPSRLGELSKLETLVLSSNKLTGPIPGNLVSITSLSRFAGDVLSNSNLETLDLSSNMLEGPIQETLSANNLLRLRLGNNSLSGKIPSSICDKLQKLVYLELENNRLNGSIPSELGSCTRLQLLSLAQNRFSGELPVELSSLTNLAVLNLQVNELIGKIPIEISKLSNLSSLNISSNHLTGTIPGSISRLGKLVMLDLQGNNLNGSIPSGLQMMTQLGEVQLGMNRLSGSIPLMSTNIYTLNLSNNLFKEAVPDFLYRLSNLQVLDLSNNGFFGEVPNYFTKMSSLIQLLLANNNLSGTLPPFTPNVDVVIKPGNPYLKNITAGPSTEHNHHKRASVGVTTAIVLSSAITGIIVAGLAVALLRRFCRMREPKIQTREDTTANFIEGCLLTVNGIHRSNIDFSTAMEAVGRGINIVMITRFMTYYKAVMPSGSRYFVKKLNWSGKIIQLGSHENFKKELEVLGRLNNTNVMVPLAYMLTDDSAYLFYEYAHKGTLFDILHGSSGFALDWSSRYSIGIGVAQGLAFLHGCSNGPVLLFDLSSKTIMLKSVKEPQIGDIELCKVIDPLKSTGSLSAVAGSVGYIPPEYAYTMRVTTGGNVYSFGVILLELITGKPAVSEGIELAKWVISKTTEQQKWDYILDPAVSQASVAVQSQMLAVLRIALACVDVQFENRPTMKSIPRMLLNAR